MSTASEWSDMLPHSLKVTSKGMKDDFGVDSWDIFTERTYQCLIDDSQSTKRTQEGVTLNGGVIAYTNAIPVGKTAPQNILNSDKVEILTPVEYSRVRPVESIARHYWRDGSLHNLEIKFS